MEKINNNLNLGYLLKTGWQALSQKPWRNLTLILIPQIIYISSIPLVSKIFSGKYSGLEEELLKPLQSNLGIKKILAAMLVLSLISLFTSSLGQLVSFGIADSFFKNQKIKLFELLKRKYLGLLKINFLAYLYIVIGFMLIIPGLYFAYRYLLSGLAFLEEDKKTAQSLLRSREIMKQNGMVIVTYSILVWLTIFIITNPLTSLPLRLGEVFIASSVSFWFYVSLYVLYKKWGNK